MDIVDLLEEANYRFDFIINEFKELESLKYIEQNQKFHGEGDVLTHTKMVCEEVIKLREWKALGSRDRAIVYLSALFHDIGKGITSRIEDGKIVSPHHGKKGSKAFRALMYKKYVIDIEIREEVAALIKYHGLPLFFIDRYDIDYTIIKAAEEANLKLLYLLSKADALGRICKDKNILIDNIEYFKEYSKEIGCYEKKKEFSNNYTAYEYLRSNKVWYGGELYDSREFVVYMMVGIPYSGKDSYIEKNLQGIKEISLDKIREKIKARGSRDELKVVSLAIADAKELLRDKISFVWNATNLKRENRIKLANLFNAYGAEIKYIYLEVPYSEIVNRYNKREREVPINVVNRMIENFDELEAEELRALMN